jgi:hypothetical protein
MDILSASATAHEDIPSTPDSGVDEGDQRLGRYIAPQEIPPAPPLAPTRSEKRRMRAAARAVASRPAPTEVRLGESAWGQVILGLPHTDAAGWLARAKLAFGTVSAPRMLGPRRPRSSPVVGAPRWLEQLTLAPQRRDGLRHGLAGMLDARGGAPPARREQFRRPPCGRMTAMLNPAATLSRRSRHQVPRGCPSETNPRPNA